MLEPLYRDVGRTQLHTLPLPRSGVRTCRPRGGRTTARCHVHSRRVSPANPATKRWLHVQLPGIARCGVKRLVRAVFGISGRVELGANGRVTCIVLNQAIRLAQRLLAALQTLASSAGVAVRLGET
jgi:hypothetical protein